MAPSPKRQWCHFYLEPSFVGFRLTNEYSMAPSPKRQWCHFYLEPSFVGFALSFTCKRCARMEAFPFCCRPSMALLWIFIVSFASGWSAQVPRQGRQRIESVARTVTVAVTQIAYENQPTLCISLINATRPCVGRQVQWSRIRPDDSTEANVTPAAVLKVEVTDAPAMSRLNDRDLELVKLDDRLLLSSLKETPEEENGRQQSNGFLRQITSRFSNALGLARTVVRTFTETRTMTTTYTESVGYNHFYISDCIPPTLYYPICKNYTSNEEEPTTVNV